VPLMTLPRMYAPSTSAPSQKPWPRFGVQRPAQLDQRDDADVAVGGQQLAVAGGEVDGGVADLQGEADAELLLGVLQDVVHIAEAVEAEVVLEGHGGAAGEAGAVDLQVAVEVAST
jgi:hypothetical protein